MIIPLYAQQKTVSSDEDDDGYLIANFISFQKWLLLRHLLPREIISHTLEDMPLIENARKVLTKLTLSKGWRYHIHLLGSYPHLTSLSLGKVMAGTFDRFLILNPQLQRIQVDAAEYEILSKIVNNCFALRHLEIQTAELRDLLILSTGCLNLHSLGISCKHYAMNIAFNDEIIQFLLDSFPNLICLSLKYVTISNSLKIQCIRRALPSIMNTDPATQLLGVKCLDWYDWRVRFGLSSSFSRSVGKRTK